MINYLEFWFAQWIIHNMFSLILVAGFLGYFIKRFAKRMIANYRLRKLVNKLK